MTTGSTCEECGGRRYRFLEATGPRWEAVVCQCVQPCPEDCDGGWLMVPVDHEMRRVSVGSPDHYTEAAAHCPTCHGASLAADRLNRARLPGQHDPRASKPRNGGQRFVFKVLKRWVKAWEPGAPGLTLSGPVGMGKSHAMVAALRALAERGAVVRYTQVAELLAELRAAMDTAGDSSSLRLMAVCTVPVLGLDEVKGPLRTEWQRETLTEVLMARYQANLTTILTTNLDQDGLHDLFGTGLEGERIVSRLNEWAPVLEVEGPDLRGGGHG